ncbi:MAG: response regulator [Phycisphaerales bacterium]|nr:response regulator [Phycisphaerales bacterium]MCI0630112.1 response regulator [Phycisphaerales bacterium]MCI0675392.1 response regulator [Phycisphaerales bacterium]
MDPLDEAIADVLGESGPGSSSNHDRSGGQILIASADSAMAARLTSWLSQRGHRCTSAGSLKQAHEALNASAFDVMVLHRPLEGGDGMDLVGSHGKRSPFMKVILMSESALWREAIEAIREGVVDLITTSVDMEEFGLRVDAAVAKSRHDRRREQKVHDLKNVCRELNVVRQEIAKHVDSLCADLVSAHQDIAEQISDVAMVSEFRTLLRQELDVEDLLRTMLEYLLTKTGATNAAVFLADATRGLDSGAMQFGLGAYVNYDCPRQTVADLLDQLGAAIGPRMANERGIAWYEDGNEFAEWVGVEASILADSHVVSFACRHREECLAVIVLFRSKSNPFDRKLSARLESLRGIIGEQLANVIRIHHRARPSWPKEARDGDLDYRDDAGSEFGGGLAA